MKTNFTTSLFKFKLNSGRLGLIAALFVCMVFTSATLVTESSIEVVSYTVDPASQELAFYWKDDSLKNLSNFERLNDYLATQKKKLVFATNGGMYDLRRRPVGLYIERGVEHHTINTGDGYGNFYLKPNGIFYLTKNKKAFVCATLDYVTNNDIAFATQSGPMLVHQGAIHSSFKKGSKNLNIRNGVGILPDGKVLFAMSKSEVNFYDFAKYFLDMGCKEALYLDGFVSRTYLPAQNWIQTDGDFGVMIAVTDPMP